VPIWSLGFGHWNLISYRMNQEGQIDGSISLDRFRFVDAVFVGL
jgi:hypothetical protein